ncbi:MAG TPA: G8 domain-containing protein [Lacunisphaera sp.]
MKTSPSRLYSQRGSLLIVSMIMCAVIGISIVSYINLGRASQNISNRALYNNGAMNIAENGMEEAMYSINKMVADDTYSWTGDGWTSANSGEDAQRRWTGYTFDQNATGVVRVYVRHADGARAPIILARATVTLGGVTSAPIEKWIKVQLAMTSKFANGLVAKNTISFSGTNASVNSWNSDPDNDPTTAAIPYSTAVDNDNGSVGSVSVTAAVSVNNADIWGYVATGGTPASIGPNGLVGPFGTAAGTVAPGHSSTDFTASFDNVTTPVATYTPIGSITSTMKLPSDAGVTASADGKYYIECPSIAFNNKTLTIEAGKEVVLKLTDATTAINIGGGSGALNIESTGKLIVYAAGDIKIAGNGILNGGSSTATANQPANCQFWGTKTSGTQDIQIAGNGVLSAIVYAPFGSVTINGNGDVCGSVVANDIKVTGNAAFHYDESLGNFGGNPYRVASWAELTTATARAAACTELLTTMTF